MNRLRCSRLIAAAFALAIVVGGSARAEITSEEKALVEGVFQRLAAVSEKPEGFEIWPPELGFIDNDEFQAFAAFFRREDGSPYPVMRVHGGIIDHGFQGKPEFVAMVIGHELAHHILGHTGKQTPGGTQFTEITFTREQEYAADRLGLELALKAGYSRKTAISMFRRWSELGLDYSSFEGLGYDHPSPTDRIAALDKDQPQLWRSMSAFESGVYFLLTQQYQLAERSFRHVTKEFPDSHEAWANLGYALLMQYADALDPDDLRKFDLGQIVIGGFYRRPASLAAKVRGLNEEMWWEAVGALREALRLNPTLALAKANLGVAYLVAPSGKDPGKAVPLLEEARDLAAKDTGLDPVSRLSLAVNLAVAYGAGGKSQEFEQLIAGVESAIASASEAERAGLAAVSGAITYNRAFALAASGDTARRGEALGQLESYLRSTSPSVAWWQLAYDRYAALCQATGATAKSRDALIARAPLKFRQVLSLEIGKAAVSIGDKLVDAQKALGPGVVSPVVAGTNLVRVAYTERGIELLATDVVLAVHCVSDGAPPVPLRAQGLSTAKTELKVGMTVDQLDAALGSLAQSYDFRPIADPNVKYRFYSDLGLAIRVQKGRVVEIAMALVPKEEARTL